MFDNLYFVGQTEYSAWAVTTSAGIILIDAIFDYSVEDEVVGGLRKLGLDPAQIKYVIVSHGHDDHVGGAEFLQDSFNARVVISAADWDLLERATGSWRKPKRDMVATDGQKLTLGDTTLTLHVTPGHTLGTISTLIPVRTRASRTWPRTGAAPRSTGCANRAAYITPERPRRASGSAATSTRRGASASWRRRPAPTCSSPTTRSSTDRRPSCRRWPPAAPADPHPYVIGPDGGRTLPDRRRRVREGRAVKGAVSAQ